MDSVDKIPIIERQGKVVTVIKGKMVNFGELGALLGERRTATIVTKTDSVIARIPVAGGGFSKTILKILSLGSILRSPLLSDLKI